MLGLAGQRAEDEHIECALEEVESISGHDGIIPSTFD
jgi:hypothetical protein